MSKVKITFPKKKETIKISEYKSLYVVICKFMGGNWGLADFWDLPYSSTSYFEALKFKHKIRLIAEDISNLWNKKKFAVMKIAFKAS